MVSASILKAEAIIICIDAAAQFFDYRFLQRGTKVLIMNSRMLWSRILRVVGGIAILLGTLDPLEGSLLILPGSGLVALGIWLGGKQHQTVLYWAGAFILITLGVAAMFALSAVGGIGGRSGHSMWWGLLMIPYPAGWLMMVLGAAVGLVRILMAKRHTAHA